MVSLERALPHYFGAGPALLPTEVLQQAAAELIDYQNIGIGVGEISHRSGPATAIIDSAKDGIKKLLDVPDTHEVFFLQGGGTTGFAAAAYNLMAAFAKKTNKKGKADYFVTGVWSTKAEQEAKRLGFDTNIVVNAKDHNNGKFGIIPPESEWKFSNPKDTAYIYMCDNETVHGVEFPFVPKVPEGVELVADLSSNFLSRKIDVSKYGLILAGAQKNVGIAGITIYIIKKSLLDIATPDQLRELGIPIAPIADDFPTVVKNNSAYNTIPIFTLRTVDLVVQRLLKLGGIEAQEALNEKEAALIYSVLDSYPSVYSLPVYKDVRSIMNIVFTIPGEGREDSFLKKAAEQGLTGLKGHRSVGGIRVSNYNAVAEESINKLAAFIKNFAENVGN